MRFRLILFASCVLLLSACNTVSAAPPLVTATSVPTAVPTATNVPPTLAPTFTPTAVPPTTVPTLPPTSVPPTQALSANSQACANAFYPISPTAQWQYRIRSSLVPNANTSFSQTVSDITANSFIEHRVVNGVSVNTNWTCSNGALSTAQLGDLNALLPNQIQLSTTSQTGVTIPSQDQWQVGTTWVDNLGVSGQITTPIINASGTGTANVQSKVVSLDAIQVPAGTFNAYRVDSSIALNLTGTAAGASAPVNANITMSEWFAQGVGLVRATLSVGAELATMDLVSTDLTQAQSSSAAPQAAPTSASSSASAPASSSSAASSSASSSANSSSSSQTSMVSIHDLAFNPSSITVPVGTTVLWTNNENGSIQHIVASGTPGSPSGMFDSGALNPGQSFQFTFTQPGTFTYYCRIHGAAMTGTVVVTP